MNSENSESDTPDRVGMVFRRLPIYLLLDSSASMQGEPIKALHQAVNALVAELIAEPVALETVWLSAIRFGREASQIVPLTELTNFTLPPLVADPSDAEDPTNLGQALQVLLECLRKETIPSTPHQKGDFKPLVFVMADGPPTDPWESLMDEIRCQVGGIAVLAAGPALKPQSLRALSPQFTSLAHATPDLFRDWAKWVTQSMKANDT